jgi:hypothetical protein
MFEPTSTPPMIYHTQGEHTNNSQPMRSTWKHSSYW